jgi:cytochrome b6-f complex iron-sulfur subunit
MNRRETLKTIALTTTALSTGMTTRAQTTPPKPVGIAKPEQVPKPGSSLSFEFDGDPALLVRVAQPKTASPRVLEVVVAKEKLFFTAYTLVCTHLGCRPDYRDNALECPCHGSRYDAYGSPTRGPAKEALQGIKLELRRGMLTAVSRLA